MTEKTQATRFDNTGMKLRSLNIMSKFGVYVMIAFLLILGTIVAPDIFLTLNNMIDIIEVGVLLGVVALGVTFVTYSGISLDTSQRYERNARNYPYSTIIVAGTFHLSYPYRDPCKSRH